LLAGTGSVSTRSRAEVEAAGIVEEAEAQALEITKRGDAVTAQLQSFEAFLNALHTPVFDDTAFGSASSPST
jgi:hypothetical protein